jgi:hypothetical protein
MTFETDARTTRQTGHRHERTPITLFASSGRWRRGSVEYLELMRSEPR